MTSGLFWASGRARWRRRTASWVLSVQRFGSMAMAYLLPDAARRTVRCGATPAAWRSGHQVAPVVTVGLLDRVARLGPDPLELGPQAGHLGLELEHPADPFEVEPGGGEVLDVAEPLDVALASSGGCRPRCATGRPGPVRS